MPLDSEIFISKVKAQTLSEKQRAGKDARSVARQRYAKAVSQSKPQMAIEMLKRALRKGFKVKYLVADSWYGTKTMIGAAVGMDLCAILRLKKGNMKFQLTTPNCSWMPSSCSSVWYGANGARWRICRGKRSARW